MKNTTTLALLVAVLSLTACAKQATVTENDKEITELNDSTAVDSVAIDNDREETDVNAGKELTVTGTVTAINRGKDGYTATLKTTDDKMYLATISIPNLDDPKQYRSAAIGDVITVTGESFPIENDMAIRVRILQ